MIIWIASYPKSGNTWVRSLLSTYLYSNNGEFDFDLLYKIPQFPEKKFFDYFTKDFSDIKKISNYWIAAQDRINLYKKNETTFLKTHSALCTLENNSFTNRNNTKAVIYIVRDPRNVITSLSNHYSFNIDESYNFLTNTNKILTKEEWGESQFGIATVLGTWADHYKSWINIKFAPILIVKYEDLINNTENSFKEILNFLKKNIDIEINDKKIINTVKNCSFDKLSEMEKKKGFHEAVYSKNTEKKINFFHLGKKNNWKNLLNPEMIQKIEKKFYKEIKELKYI